MPVARGLEAGERGLHMSRVIRCKYDVVGLEPNPQAASENLLERALSMGVVWNRINRVRNSAHFRPATYGIQGNSDPLRRCQPDLWAPRSWILHGASEGWSITCETRSDTLGPLQAAMALASACARGCKNAVVIDRTTSIGYSASQFFHEQRGFNEQGRLDVRDHVLIYEHVTGSTARVRTYGMEKFGQENFLVEDFPATYLEELRWFMNGFLCPQAGMDAPIHAGHTFRYRMGNGGALAFAHGPEDCLTFSDCVAPAVPISGLKRFLQNIPPFYAEWKNHQLAKTEAYISEDETAEVLAVLKRYQNQRNSDVFPIPLIETS